MATRTRQHCLNPWEQALGSAPVRVRTYPMIKSHHMNNARYAHVQNQVGRIGGWGNRQPTTLCQSHQNIRVTATSQSSLSLERIGEIGTMMFPIWALISASMAYFYPTTLNWMSTTNFEQGVGLLMLSMGLSLRI